MRILALDTSTEIAGIALLDGDRIRFSHSFLHRMDLSQRLLPTLEWLLRDSGIALDQIEALGVGLGPGSFTGVRIGVTTIKTLAQVTGLPVAGIGTLEVMAAGVAPGPEALLCPCIDARKHEVYAAAYRAAGNGLVEVLSPRSLPAAALASLLGEYPDRIIVCGTGAARYRETLSQAVGARLLTPAGHDFPDPAVLARLARRRLDRGERDDPLALRPIYARLSEAERNLCGGTRDEGRGASPDGKGTGDGGRGTSAEGGAG